MRYKILLSTVCIFSFITTLSQTNQNTAFAVVNNSNGKLAWMNIQEIDLSTGQVTRQIFDKEKTKFVMIDGSTKKPIKMEQVDKTPKRIAEYEHPTATMVAAAAFDKRHNRLFFTPMRFAELRWIDLSDKNASVKVYCLSNQLLSEALARNEGSQVTRMTIAADGNGYALTNDGYFVRFTTGKKPVVTQLGQLKDDPSNDKKSIRNRESWGGDMIADAFGNLYVIAANTTVYRININDRVATYIGTLQGLPQSFTTNGAAVDNNGDVIVSNAYTKVAYYKVNIETLEAKKLEIPNEVFASSDLASGNLAFQNAANNLRAPMNRANVTMLNKNISFYPNPVTYNYFKLSFQNNEKGRYDIQLVDLDGKIVFQKYVNLSMRNQTENILVDARLSRGMYIIKILNGAQKQVSSGNILLQ